MRVLCLVNQKGGCGKTTVAINLAAALHARGERVLLVDLDPQAHATLGVGWNGELGPTLGDVLCERVTAREALAPVSGGMQLLASNGNLVEFEDQSARRIRPESVLREVLREVASEFDYAVLDCPARADGVLTANALCAASTCVLVVETGAFALQGALRALRLLEETAQAQGSQSDLRVLGTLFDRRTRFARELLVALHSRFGPRMYDTAIRTSVRLREAAACGRPIQLHAPHSGAAADFAALAEEVRADHPVLGRELTAIGEPAVDELPVGDSIPRPISRAPRPPSATPLLP
jgi:chromosome partitioning protein